MTIKKSVEFLRLLYDRLEIGEESVDVSDISVPAMIEAVDIAIEALEAIDDFNGWRKEVYGNEEQTVLEKALEEIGELSTAWEYGAGVTDCRNIIKKYMEAENDD